MNGPWSEMLVGLPVAWTMGLRMTAVLAVAWLLHLALAKCNPRWRVLLWRGAAVGVVLVPVLVLFLPKLEVSVERDRARSAASDLASLPGPHFLPGAFDGPEDLSRAEALSQAESASPGAPVGDVAAVSLATPENATFPWTFALGTLALAVWALGLMALAVRWCSAQVVVWRRVRGYAVAPEECRRLLEQIASRIGCSRRTTLLMATDLDAPFAAGVRKAVIVLPARMCRSDYAAELPGILAHELSHHHSRDLAWMVLHHWIQMLGWAHPLVWRICQVHAMSCEEVADTTAAHLVGNVQHYTGTLARVALSVRSVPPVEAAISMARSPEILTRVARLRRGLQFVPLTRRMVWGTVVAGLVGLVGLAGFEFVLAEAPNPSEAGARVLRFPQEHSVGKLWTATAEEPHWQIVQRAVDYHRHWDWLPLTEAKGTVNVPAGAKVKLQVNAAGAQDMSWTSQLAPGDLHTLEVIGQARGGVPFGDAQLRHLRPLTGLQELGLFGVQVTDQGLQALEPLASLKVLLLGDPAVGNGGLKHLGRLKSLEVLSLVPVGKCNAAGLAHLSGLKALREFFFDAQSIPAAALAPIAKLPTLIYVCSGEGFSDEHLLALQPAKSLKGLRIQGSNVTDAGLRHLQGLKQLEYLDLWSTGISDAGLVHLKALPALKHLNARVATAGNESLITSRGIAQLAEIPSLEYLDLPNLSMTDACCEQVARLPNLRYLWMGCYSGSPITDQGLQHLAGLRHLESLSISGTGITDAGIAHLAELKNLRLLHLFTAPQVSNAGLAPLGRLTSLETLALPQSSRITLSGLNQLNGLSNLQVLGFQPSGKSPPEEAVLDLSGLTQLRQLTLLDVRDADLACLSQLKHLEWLMLGGRGIGDAGAAHVAGLVSLTRLSIGGPAMTDAGLASLSGLTNLTDLYVTGNFSDAGMTHLLPLKGLELLKAQSTQKLGAQSKESLKKGLPNLRHLSLDDERVPLTEAASNNVGKVAPTFQATTLEGKALNLADSRGKVVLLYFWSLSCKPCLSSIPELKKDYDEVRKADPNFTMIGLSMDSIDLPVQQRVAQDQLPWVQVRIGEDSRIASDYGVRGVPRFVLIDREGYIRYDGAGGQELVNQLKATLAKK